MDKSTQRDCCCIVELAVFPNGSWNVYLYSADISKANNPNSSLCPNAFLRDFITKGTIVTILDVIWADAFKKAEALARQRRDYWMGALEHSDLVEQEEPNHE